MDTNLQEEIEDALTNGHFFLEYQPIMRLRENTCVGAEALIRLQRQSEVVPPLEFIPAIENTPLSGLVTYWVIERIGQELGNWLRNTDHALLSINVPPEILGRGGVLYAASKAGLSDIFDKLIIEITERGIPDSLGIRALHHGQSRGMTICLDDVGVNDENILLLSRANVDIVKLDKSFADKMLGSDWSPASLNSIAALTRSTEIRVIAEGIETQLQRDAFREAGIQMAQGWYFSPSLSATKFMDFFQTNKD